MQFAQCSTLAELLAVEGRWLSEHLDPPTDVQWCGPQVPQEDSRDPLLVAWANGHCLFQSSQGGLWVWCSWEFLFDQTKWCTSNAFPGSGNLDWAGLQKECLNHRTLNGLSKFSFRCTWMAYWVSRLLSEFLCLLSSLKQFVSPWLCYSLREVGSVL